jgi:hypothetical protein
VCLLITGGEAILSSAFSFPIFFVLKTERSAKTIQGCRTGEKLFRDHADIRNHCGVITWLNAAHCINSCKPDS